MLHRYARGIDRLDWDLVRDCYHPDAYDDHGGIAGSVDDFIAGGRKYLTRFAATMHFLGNMLIEVDGDRARAETYAVAYHRVEDADGGGGGKDDIFGIRYVDRFERRMDRWRIAHRVVANEWRRVEPVPPGRGRAAYDGVWGSRDKRGRHPLDHERPGADIRHGRLTAYGRLWAVRRAVGCAHRRATGRGRPAAEGRRPWVWPTACTTWPCAPATSRRRSSSSPTCSGPSSRRCTGCTASPTRSTGSSSSTTRATWPSCRTPRSPTSILNSGSATPPIRARHRRPAPCSTWPSTCDDEAQLLALRDRIRDRGVNVFGPLDHGLCKSIYFAGPEGMNLEVSTSEECIDERAWIDPDVVEKAGISGDELARYLSPAAYQDEGGRVAQPPIDPAKPHMVWPPDAYEKLMTTPDEIITAQMSEPDPPVKVMP